jgi:hypothetical protein
MLLRVSNVFVTVDFAYGATAGGLPAGSVTDVEKLYGDLPVTKLTLFGATPIATSLTVY